MTDTQTPENITLTAEPDMAALVAKHRVEIDRVKALDSVGQKAAFELYGVDPSAIADHYKPLADEADKLRQRSLAADEKTTFTGLASLVIAGAATFLGRKKISPSPIVQGFAVPLVGGAAGFAGTFAGSRVFADHIREDSRLLTIESKNALERELAVAIENKEREGQVQASAPVKPDAADRIDKRDPSFAAQATADKVAASASAPQRA